MKAVLAIIVLTLVGRAYCIVKRQCNCFNAREFASRSCTGITEFDNLFTVSSTVSGVRGNITSFGSVLDKIAERTDKQSVINEICTSQNCFSRLEALYSCCSVDSSAGNGLTTRFNDVARDFACNRPSPTSLNYCANNINDVTTIMNDCALTNNQCNDRCAATLRRFRSSCCVISYYELLTDEAQQRTLSQDIWNSCGITAPSKCSNSLCFSPNFTATGQDTVVDNGGVYTVTCRAEGEEEIRYELLKDENEAFGFQPSGIFNLENIDGNDGGHYRCVASNECGTEQSDVFIIYVQPRITITAPSGTKLIDTEQIDLQCTGNGYPEPIIQWMFNDMVIRSGNRLVISNLTINDSGVYYCMGSNSVGSANESITITVFPAPTPTSSVASVTSTYVTMTSSITTELKTTTSIITELHTTISITVVEGTLVAPDKDDNEKVTVILAVVVPLIILNILIIIIVGLLYYVYYRKQQAEKHRKTDKRALLRNDPLSMVTLKEETIKTPDTENPLTPSDPFSTGVGLIGISEAVEPEAESSHDSVDVVSVKDQKDVEAPELEQQETAFTEPEPGEIETKEQDISKEQEISIEQETAKVTEGQEITKKSDKLESRPPGVRIPRSNSVAERAKMFEEKMSSPTIPPHSPRKPKIKLPTAEPTISMEVPEGELIDLEDPPVLLPPPSETPPPPPLEPPPQSLEALPPQLEALPLQLETAPPELEPPPPPLEPPPPPPLEPPPPPPLEPPPSPLELLPSTPPEPPPSSPPSSEPPPLEVSQVVSPPTPSPLELLPSTPPEPPPSSPPSSEPPLLEVSQVVSPPMDQTDSDMQLRSSTMPASEKKKIIRKVTEKKRSATVIKVIIKSNPLTPDALNQLVQNAAEAAADGEDDDNKIENLLAKEFHSIPMNFPRQADLPKGCAVKDRYTNVKPNPQSRVLLQSMGDELSTYINANYIRGLDGKTAGYIAAQGPTEASMGDFWRMVWEQDVSIIVMLTGLVENGKVKCNRYWPEYYGDDNLQYGSMVVINTSEKKGPGFYTSRLSIYSVDNPLQQREVTHFWFTAWPDFGVPENTSSILALRKRVHDKRGTNGSPIVVHCSAGIGRTGVFCAVDMGMQQYDCDCMVNPLQYLSQMRQDRGGMIQKTKQYEFVCQVLLDYIKSKKR